MWKREQSNKSAAYNLPRGFILSGKLNVLALEKAFQQVICRHFSLRSLFVTEQGVPMLNFLHAPMWKLQVVELKNLSHPMEAVKQRFIQEESTPFDLHAWPLFRIVLFKISGAQHVLLLNFHHIIFDMGSWQILFNELKILYESILLEKTKNLPYISPDLAIYDHHEDSKSYLFWQNIISRVKLANWLDQKPVYHRWTYAGTEFIVALAENESVQLHEYSRKNKMTLSMLLLAIYAATLFKYVDSEILHISIPVTIRNMENIQNLIGLYVSTIVISIVKSEELGIYSILQQVKEKMLESCDNQCASIEQLLLIKEQESGYTERPLPQFNYNFHAETATSDLELENVKVERLNEDTRTAKNDLTLSVRTDFISKKIKLRFEHSSDILQNKIIMHFAQAYIDQARTFLLTT